jgi:hypothetical protein
MDQRLIWCKFGMEVMTVLLFRQKILNRLFYRLFAWKTSPGLLNTPPANLVYADIRKELFGGHRSRATTGFFNLYRFRGYSASAMTKKATKQNREKGLCLCLLSSNLCL